MIIISPYDFPEAWNRLVIGGYTLPGLMISVDGVERAYDWVVQKGTGTSGAASVYRGVLLTETMTVVHEIPRTEMFVELQKAIPLIVPPIGQKAPTHNVKNQIFEFVGIDRIALRSYGIKPSAGNSWQVTTKWIEYSPTAPTKTGSADPAKDGATTPAGDPQIVSLQKQADALTKGFVGGMT